MSSDGTQIHAMQQENLVLRDQFAQLRHLLDQTKGANSELVSENVLLKTELQRFKEQLEQKIKEFDELMVAYRSVSSDRSQSDDEVRSRLAEEVAVKTQLQHQVTELQEFRALYMELRREVQSRENNFRMELDAKAKEAEEMRYHFEQQITVLQHSNIDLQSRLDARSEPNQIAMLQHEKRDLEAQLHALQEELEVLRHEHERLSVNQVGTGRKTVEKMAELQRCNQELAVELCRQREMTRRLEEEQVAEKEESEKLHRELLKTQGDMAHLRGQLDSMNQFFAAERAALRQSAREREAEIEKDKLTVQEKLFDCEKRFGQVEARCHQLMLGKSEVERLSAAKLMQVQEECDERVRVAEGKAADVVMQFESALTKHDLDAQNWKDTIEELQREAQQSQIERESQQQTHRDLCTKIENLEERISWLVQERDAALEEVARLTEWQEDVDARLQETLSLGDENKHLKLQNAHAQQTIEQLTTEGQNVKDELTNSILKIRQAAAEEQGLLQQRITKLHAELKKAAKVIDKQKATFSTALVRAEKRNQQATQRVSDLQAHKREQQERLDLMTETLRQTEAQAAYFQRAPPRPAPGGAEGGGTRAAVYPTGPDLGHGGFVHRAPSPEGSGLGKEGDGRPLAGPSGAGPGIAGPSGVGQGIGGPGGVGQGIGGPGGMGQGIGGPGGMGQGIGAAGSSGSDDLVDSVLEQAKRVEALRLRAEALGNATL